MAEFISSPVLAVPHGFFTRRGGVSTGIHASLNCSLSKSDDLTAAHENRSRVCSALGAAPASLTSLWQVHGNEVVTLAAPIAPQNRPKADAMVTATGGITLGILTADCAPLLFHDPVAKVIGAAHSGWKGTLGNIAHQTIKAMQALGARPANITAAIGPCITADSYEVGPEFPAPFEAAGYGRFFIPSRKAGHFMFDLKSCIHSQLAAAGVTNVNVLPNDTYKEEADFYSNRRATHRGEAGFGLQISAIRL